MDFFRRSLRLRNTKTKEEQDQKQAKADSGDGRKCTTMLDFDAVQEVLPQVTVLLVGAGSRGMCYTFFAIHFPKRMKVVGVVDPRPSPRERVKLYHELDDANIFEDWRPAVEKDKFADAVIIATPDRFHKDPAIAFAKKGYHILLEKPMAVTPEDCEEIVAACQESGVMLAVGHVMRYYPICLKMKELIDSGAIGDLVHIQHMEPVGFWHFAHSFVRGNWRNEDESTFCLLAKSCHDIDLINFWMGERRCLKVSSFGHLSHFTKEHKPKGAASRCLDCSVEESCPYSVQKIYLKGGKQGQFGWPTSVVCSKGVYDIESLTEELRTGPYGRCVYECDNDVVTNQVVNLEFDGGVTAAFTMMAFTYNLGVRETRVYGSKGELRCKGGGPVEHFDFVTGTRTEHMALRAAFIPIQLLGHGGADYYLIENFTAAVAAYLMRWDCPTAEHPYQARPQSCGMRVMPHAAQACS
ncbi:putative oxidoreductase YteT isoform X2 [Ambystoma mexicanum]|uniref:putative oxidoreductase YteT isoform X2 n=1 Tax=Ambystoma mexicanum TaxID=8296 RepID=UPI0037E7ADC3